MQYIHQNDPDWTDCLRNEKNLGSFISQLRGASDVILARAMCGQTIEYTQSGSGHYPSMMEKSAPPGDGEGCTPTPFHYIYHQVQSCGTSTRYRGEGRYTPPISTLPLYVLCGTDCLRKGKKSDPSFHSWEELVTSYLQGIRAVWGQTHRVHTEWQWPLSGVYSIMMEKSAHPGESGGCTPTPFHYIYHHAQSCGVRCRHTHYSVTHPISTLPLYVLCG
jgi:hypothetical protein